MKKLFFGLACFIGLMFFASCTQEVIDDLLAQNPTVEFVAEDGYISGNTGVYVGETLNFKVKVAPNTSSASPLSHLDFSITDLSDVTVFNENPTFTDPNGENIFEFTFTPRYASTYVVTATITDEAGKTNLVTAVVDYVEPVVEGIGTFKGSITLYGHITSNEIAGQQAYDQDMDPEEIPVTITMGALSEDNRVSATLDIDGTPVTIYGTMDENNEITFEEFHFNKTITLFVNVTLDLTMNVIGAFEDDKLSLNGTAVGQGKTFILFDNLIVDYDGNFTGVLEPVE